MKVREPSRHILRRDARSTLVRDINALPSTPAAPEPVNGTLTELARVIAISNQLPRLRSHFPLSAQIASDDWRCSYHAEMVRQLEQWKAPSLPDEILATLGTIFLMQRGHELTPFFVWLEQRLLQL